MKSLFLILLSSAFLTVSKCGNEHEVKLSKSMKGFVSMLKGKAHHVEAALEKYGANDEIKVHEMTYFNLENPRVIGRQGNRYTMLFKAGMTTRKYHIYWEGKKIVKITDFGMVDWPPN